MTNHDDDEEEKIYEIIDNFMKIFSNIFGIPYRNKERYFKKESSPKRFSALDVSVLDKDKHIEIYMNAPGLDAKTIKVYLRDGNLFVYGKRDEAELFEKIDLKGKGRKIKEWDYHNGILSIVVSKKKRLFSREPND